jgi:putative ubiquitin-RnfH superfamily antitoxin RatB of RatAB toxin-antitoxin module
MRARELRAAVVDGERVELWAALLADPTVEVNTEDAEP